MHVFLIALVLLGLASRVEAQPDWSVKSDTISSSTDSFIAEVRGMASLRVQTMDTYSGTWEIQCSLDGSTFDTDDEVNMFLEGASSAAVQEVTDTVGIWTASVAGCTHVRVIATAGFAASDTKIAVGAVGSGGSPGAGAGGGAVTQATSPWVVSPASGSFATDVVFGTGTYTEATSTGPISGSVRNDSLDALANTTNEVAPLATSAEGALWTTPSATTNGGCTPNSSISTAAVLETEIKATAGQLYYLAITNLDATNVYARLYNLTAANADESDTPIQRFLVPTGSGFVLPIPVGAVYSTAITLRVTTGAADNDTGALAANEVFVSYCYK